MGFHMPKFILLSEFMPVYFLFHYLFLSFAFLLKSMFVVLHLWYLFRAP